MFEPLDYLAGQIFNMRVHLAFRVERCSGTSIVCLYTKQQCRELCSTGALAEMLDVPAAGEQQAGEAIQANGDKFMGHTGGRNVMQLVVRYLDN